MRMPVFVDFEFHFSKALSAWFDRQNTDPVYQLPQLGKKWSQFLLVTLFHYFKLLLQHTSS